jgi:sec-independent protein translocase protein TatC
MLIFLVAAVITPSGDPISLFALSLPMCILYGLSVGIGFLIAWRRQRRSRAAT